MSLDRDPGFYDGGGSATALVEQQRAYTLDNLRKAKAASVTYISPDDGDGVHWAIDLRQDEDASTLAFLTYAVCRAWRDATAVSNCDDDTMERITRAALDAGVGS